MNLFSGGSNRLILDVAQEERSTVTIRPRFQCPHVHDRSSEGLDACWRTSLPEDPGLYDRLPKRTPIVGVNSARRSSKVVQDWGGATDQRCSSSSHRADPSVDRIPNPHLAMLCAGKARLRYGERIGQASFARINHWIRCASPSHHGFS